MKLQVLTAAEVLRLIDELRGMAALPPGRDPRALRRAKEIRFQIQGQSQCSEYLTEKLDAAYRALEVLLSTRRWKDALSVDTLRHEVKSACSLAVRHIVPISSNGAA